MSRLVQTHMTTNAGLSSPPQRVVGFTGFQSRRNLCCIGLTTRSLSRQHAKAPLESYLHISA